MSRIKNIAFSALLSIGAFSAITYTACNKDECKGVQCNNGGTCVGGSCQCPSGYEGSDCSTLMIAKFIKNWNVNEQPKITNPYTCLIATGSTITAVVIENKFANSFFGNPLTGTVSGNVLTIPEQKPDANGDYKVSGTLTSTTTGTTTTLASSYTLTNTKNSSTVVVIGTWQQQ